MVMVAPLAGSVDRNLSLPLDELNDMAVAPLAGSVDRNAPAQIDQWKGYVAPLAGSVDRNKKMVADDRRLVCRSPRGERG